MDREDVFPAAVFRFRLCTLRAALRVWILLGIMTGVGCPAPVSRLQNSRKRESFGCIG